MAYAAWIALVLYTTLCAPLLVLQAAGYCEDLYLLAKRPAEWLAERAGV